MLDTCPKEPYTVVTHRKDQRERSIHLSLPPPYLGLVFGDFVHNLRSALDQAVFELTRENAKQLSSKQRGDVLRRCGFPICTDPGQWESDPECFQGGLDKVGGVIPSRITAIEGLQPFKAVDDPKLHPLAILGQLDNRDKHRQLNVTVASAYMMTVQMAPGSYRTIPPSTRKEGAHLTVTVPSVDVDPKPALAITLTEKGPAPGAVVWAPPMSDMGGRIFRLIGLGPEPLLPEVLLACVTGILADLRT